MKTSLIACAIALLFLGCGGESEHGKLPASSIYGAVYDPAPNCAEESVHAHGGAAYSGHYNNDGHGHSGLQADSACALAGCEETGLHWHGGTHYAGRCDLAGCEETGLHRHGGTRYAGHSGDDGCSHHGGGHH